MNRRVEFSPAAITDITELLDYLLPLAGEKVSRRYVDDMMRYCSSLETFPLRGAARDDILPGLRVVGYRRKASIAFIVEDETLRILRIFHRGRKIHIEPDRSLP